jgi:hypothetical protein
MGTVNGGPGEPVSTKPHFGFTRRGLPVHQYVMDHHPENTAYQRFNKKVALALTKNVGTMSCFWFFCFLCLLVLPAVLPPQWFPSFMLFMTSFRYELFMTWMLSTCFQLTLLPALMVGQNLQNAAADARSAKTFEDTQLIADRLDTRTQGGLQEVLAAVTELKSIVDTRPV